MRLTKSGHACVRIDNGDRVLVIDPGTVTEPEALAGATAVLVTYEHDDHIDVGKLARRPRQQPTPAVYTHLALAAQDPGITHRRQIPFLHGLVPEGDVGGGRRARCGGAAGSTPCSVTRLRGEPSRQPDTATGGTKTGQSRHRCSSE